MNTLYVLIKQVLRQEHGSVTFPYGPYVCLLVCWLSVMICKHKIKIHWRNCSVSYLLLHRTALDGAKARVQFPYHFLKTLYVNRATLTVQDMPPSLLNNFTKRFFSNAKYHLIQNISKQIISQQEGIKCTFYIQLSHLKLDRVGKNSATSFWVH